MAAFTAIDEQQITGREDRDIEVPRGVRLHIFGIVDGAVHVHDHGEVQLRGTLNGPLSVELGGRVEVTGALSGEVLVNDGVIRLAEGAGFGDMRMGPTGFTIHRSAPAVTITRDTPRHRVVGTRGSYGVQY